MTAGSSPSENKAAEVFRRHGLTVSKRPTGTTRSPDFDVTSDDGFFFLVEVKEVRGAGEDNAQTWSQLYNAVTADIHDAVGQFNAVNSTHLIPNVLVLVAADFRFHTRAFLDFLHGELIVDGQQIADLGRYRWGRVKKDFAQVDMIVLVETNGGVSFFFTDNDQRFVKKLSALLNVG